MDLDDRDFKEAQRIMQGDRGVAVGAGVEDQRLELPCCLLYPGYQLPLAIALPTGDVEPETSTRTDASRVDVRESLPAIEAGFTTSEQI